MPSERQVIDPGALLHALLDRLLELVDVQQHLQAQPLAERPTQVFRGDRDGVLGPRLGLDVLGVQRLVVGGQHLVEALEHLQDDLGLVLGHLPLLVGLEQLVGEVAGSCGARRPRDSTGAGSTW